MLSAQTPSADSNPLALALASLPLSTSERAEVIAFVKVFEPNDGLRAVFVRDLVSTLATHRPASMHMYENLSKIFPARNPFAFMPLSELMVRLVCGAKILSPEKPLWDAIHTLLRLATSNVFENPAMQIARRAAGDSLRMFLELTMTGEDRFGNYIKRREVRSAGPNHIEIYAEGGYAHFDKIMNLPYAESLFANFKVDGRLELEEVGPRESISTFTWR
jgi:hypothetical protein